jgi:hypothetical protein
MTRALQYIAIAAVLLALTRLFRRELDELNDKEPWLCL